MKAVVILWDKERRGRLQHGDNIVICCIYYFMEKTFVITHLVIYFGQDRLEVGTCIIVISTIGIVPPHLSLCKTAVTAVGQ